MNCEVAGAAKNPTNERDSIESRYLALSFPLGRTVVVGGVGRVETDVASLGALVSFFGFFTILLLRCSPFAIAFSLCLCCFAVGDMEPVLAPTHSGV